MPCLSVIVPTWNGSEVLRRNLTAVAVEAARFPGGAEVLVVDDASDEPEDATGRVVAGSGPVARLVRETVHRGFGGTCNAGAAEAAGELLLFLNNDMRPLPGCLAALAGALDARPDVFAVVPVVDNREEGFFESAVRLRLFRGVFDVVQPGRAGEPPPEPGETRPVAFPCGGAFLTRRSSFLALGGFVGGYAPFYWEDVDLGWRAWCGGSGCYQVGAARVLHEHAATIGARYGRAEVAALYERNRLLFTWTHLAGLGAWAAHLAWLPARWLAACARRDPAWRGPGLALARWPGVRDARRSARPASSAARRLLATVRSTLEGGWPG